MKKIKRICSFMLVMLLILSIQMSSLAFSAATTDTAETGAPKAGDIILFYVDVTSTLTIGTMTATVTYDSNQAELIQDFTGIMPYLDQKYEPPQEYTQNANGIKCTVDVRGDATDGFDFKNGERFLELKFRLLKDTIPEIEFYFDYAKSFSGTQLFFAGLNFNNGASCETTTQLTENGKTPLAYCDITLDKSLFTYDGKEKRPTLTIKHGAHTLVPGTDYIWAYENNINPGTASVHVMPLGDYTGFSVINYTITPAGVTSVPLNNCTVTLSDTSMVYTGFPLEPEVIVKNGATTLIPGTDYIVIYNNNVEIGAGFVFVHGQGYYTGSLLSTFDIVSSEAKKTSISTCSFTMDSTFSYTGSPITPNVTVTSAGKTLVKGTDYTVSYSNNTNVGTATVKITGIGNYTDTKTLNFTIKEPEVKKVALSDCTITLSKSVYTYDGKAKTPDVTVKYGNTTLAKGTDYTVSYSNNTNVGTGKVTVTGKGNYTGSITKTFAIQEAKSKGFTWGTDNWNFNNSAPDYFPRTSYRQHISESYLNTLKKNLTNTEYYVIFEARGNWLDSQFGGSCYGMSSLTLLAKNGLVPFASYQSGATKLTDLNSPVKNKDVSSLVTYYQMLQVKDQAQQQYRTLPTRSHETNIKEILSTLDKNPLCVIGFKKNGWGGHAILAYGYEYGSWTFGGVSYDGCIKICDPNSSISYNKECNIYFNSKTYNWAIPFYSYAPITSTKGAVINYISADINKINEGGYLSGSTSNKSENFVARIDAESISDNRAVSKVVGANGMYMNQAAGPGEIVEDYSYIVGGASTGTVGYNLYDANSAYKVVQDVPTELSLSMDYEDCFMTASSMAGNSVLFDNEGYVEVTGDSANFSISMTFDDKYPTSWFTMKVEGTGANTASLQMVEDGYILSSDNLRDISLNAYSKNFSATASLSTTYDTVYIYEINETTLGAKVDKDNNGTYETEIKVENQNNLLFGDVNLDSTLNVKDATAIQKHIAGLQTLSQQGLSVADFNKDGSINVKDATTIQKKVAGLL